MAIRATFTVRGVDIELATDAEAERANMLVCLDWCDPPLAADNIRAPCAFCGVPLQHRPDAPVRPPKVCMKCAAIWATAKKH